jgi:hypothetical protein
MQSPRPPAIRAIALHNLALAVLLLPMSKPKQPSSTAKTKTRPKKSAGGHKLQSSFSETFPAIAYWVTSVGWIEIGDDDVSPTWVWALDMGGLIWESDDQTASVDQAIQAMEKALRVWLDRGRITEDIHQLA